MILRLRSFLRSRDGSAAVEMSLLALPLAALIFGAVEFGRAHWSAQALQDVAVRSARCVGVMQGECSDNEAYSAVRAKTYAVDYGRALGLAIEPGLVTIDAAATCGGQSGFARVSLEYRFRSPLEGLLQLLGKGVTLSAQACFPNQG